MSNNVEGGNVTSLPGVSTPELTFTQLGCHDLPMIEVKMAAGSIVHAEPGRMIAMPEGVAFRSILGDGSEAGFFSKLGSAASRMFSGESVFLAQFENETNEEQVMRFGTVIAGNVVPLRLQEYAGEIICQSGAYLLGSPDVKVGVCFRQTLGAAFFGGESLILQRCTGDGAVLLQGGGTVLREELTPQRPKIRVDTGCLVAFTGNVKYAIALAGGFKSMLFGGEGIFHATLELPPGQQSGIVWLESYPYSRFISIIKNMYSH